MQEKSTVERHWWLYILKLQDGKYYVGITSKTPEIRMQEHLNGIRPAYWTAKHKPVGIIYREDLGVTTKSRAERREKRYVREVMRKRGINNVRGGDLMSTDEYIQRFGYIYDKDGWNLAMATTLLCIIVMAFFIDKFVWPFIPWGVR